MAEAVKADVGSYARATEAFLTDLADGAAQFNVDLVGVYGDLSVSRKRSRVFCLSKAEHLLFRVSAWRRVRRQGQYPDRHTLHHGGSGMRREPGSRGQLQDAITRLRE